MIRGKAERGRAFTHISVLWVVKTGKAIGGRKLAPQTGAQLRTPGRRIGKEKRLTGAKDDVDLRSQRDHS